MRKDTDLIIFLISRIREKTNRFISNELEKNDMIGLLPVHGDILYALMVHRKLPMKKLAELIDRKKSTVTTLVDKMIKLGYVEKNRDDVDNRIYLISLTSKGQLYRERVVEISDKLINKVYKTMPEEERLQLVKSLKEINNNW